MVTHSLLRAYLPSISAPPRTIRTSSNSDLFSLSDATHIHQSLKGGVIHRYRGRAIRAMGLEHSLTVFKATQSLDDWRGTQPIESITPKFGIRTR